MAGVLGSTDGLGHYTVVVDAIWRNAIDYAQSIKEYKGATGDEAREFPVVNAFQGNCGQTNYGQTNVCAFITKLTAAGSDAVFSSFLGGSDRWAIKEPYPPLRDPRYGYYFLQDARAVAGAVRSGETSAPPGAERRRLG